MSFKTESPLEPQSYTEAINCAQKQLWQVSIDDEYASLIKNETWRLTTLPAGREAIKCRWVFKIKPGHHNIPERYKSRLVAKGYTQKKSLDYKETFSPVVKNSSLRVIFSLVAAHDLDIIQLDIKTAFLNGDLEEELYMEQPEGYVAPGQENLVCRLVKSLYGLKQAPRCWNIKFDAFIKKFGLIQSSFDHCVYFRRKGEEFTLVALFVDDGLLCSNQKEVLDAILEYVRTEFDMSIIPADRFLGLDITRNRKERQLFLTQEDAILRIMVKFNMTECNPKAVPSDPHTRLTKLMAPKDQMEAAEMAAIPYREAVGSLMYVMVMTRPDIAFAVGQVAQFCQNPGQAHWNAVKRIISYLAGTSNYGLCFNPGDSLTGYTDADFAGDIDTRKSTSGFVFLHNNGPVAWSSRRQPCTATSTTESEFIAACEAAKEAVWLQCILLELGEKKSGPVPVMCDNQSAIRLVRNPEFHQRTKHIDIKFQFVREQQTKGAIDVKYIGTADQRADIFTKSLAAPRFQRLRESIGVKKLKE